MSLKEAPDGTARALVLEEFNKPFSLREFPKPEVGEGEILAKVVAAGICGSDLHEYKGTDPRTPLPIIPGHEGVGEIESVGGGAVLADGTVAGAGMPVVWERSLTCGKCYFCTRGQKYLCKERKVYGINISSAEPPHLSGNYASHILLRKGTGVFRRDTTIDPAILVAATCSGATAAHAHEYANIRGGETVVIYGSGPLAAFQIAFAIEAGAKWVVVITRGPGPKAEIAHEFGADEILLRTKMNPLKITGYMLYQTNENGVDVVIDTTPDPKCFKEAVQFLRRGGTYVNPGLAIPSEDIGVEFYSDIVNKNLTIKGVWASDAGHLKKSIEIVQAGKFPFDRLVTHRFSLEDHEKAWDVLQEKKGVKLVFEP